MTKSVYICSLVIVAVVLSQKLIIDNDNGYQFNDWEVMRPQGSPFTYNYNSQIIFGGLNRFYRQTQIQKLILNLPDHDIIMLNFQIVVWDTTMVTNNIRVQLDNLVKTGLIQTLVYPQKQEFSFQFSHKSISALLNFQPTTSYDWGIIYLKLFVDKTEKDNIFIQKKMDYSLISNSLLSTEGWEDSNQLQTILSCADFQYVEPNYVMNKITRQFVILSSDFLSVYFKVFSPSLLTKIIFTIESYEAFEAYTVAQNYSCSNVNINFLYLYQLSFENIVIPQTHIVKISISIPSTFDYFGIRDFEIHFYKNETIPLPIMGCSEFQLGQCMNCLEGWNYQNNQKICLPICGDKKIQYGEQCDDGNNVPYDGCYQCKFQCQQNCDSCVFGVCQRFIVSTSIAVLDCNSNPLVYNQYNESQKKRCKSVCGNGIVDLWEECDDTNNSQYDGCFQCKFSCPLNCKQCISGRCNQCLAGYYLQKNSCQPICGDNIKQNEEQCDDGNLILFDGCYKCQNNCKLGCQQCINSYCLQCMDGWHFNNGECEQICGDNLVAIISPEQCDSNSILSCLNCEIKCAPFCSFCESLTNCFQCYDNILLVDGQCITYCGDGVVTDWEQCDDANNMQNDGCFNCKFECIFGCLECLTFDTCDLCDSEFFYLDSLTQKCILYPQIETYDATDSISDEANDNQTSNNSDQSSSNSFNTNNNKKNNSNSSDSQFPLSTNQTQTVSTILINNSNSSYGYNISESTLKLSEVICKEHYILINGICVSLCGNGVLESDYEECDDGNQDGGDGCSFQCYVEESYKCVNVENSISQCTYLTKPNFVLTLLSDKQNAIQTVQISFSQKVRLLTLVAFEEITSFSISPPIEAIIQLIPIVNATTELANVIYNIQLEFQQSSESPQLDVQIMRSNFFSDSEQELSSFTQTIKLGSPFVLSQQTQSQVNSIVQMNDAMMFSMAGISGLSLLTGNTQMFFNMLELLQQLSYLRFMKYQFPNHLKQFLETFSKISLKPLLDQLHIDEYLANINGGTLPFYNKSNKKQSTTQTNQLNQYYLMNAKSCYISLLMSLITYLMSSFIVSKKFQNIASRLLLKHKFSLSIKQKLCSINAAIRKKCYEIKLNYFFTGLFQLYFAILHQFLFSCFLQFPFYSFDSALNSINSINAIGAIIIVFSICFKSFSVPNLGNKLVIKWKYFFTENTIRFWSIYFKSFQMLKILSYIIIIVFCMDCPQVQSFLLSIQSTFYIIYLLRFRPIRQTLDQMKLICKESFFILITGSFSIYSFPLSNDQMLLCGWMHIYIFVGVMTSQLIFDFIKQIKEIYETYLKELRIKELRQEALYYNNPLQKFILIEHKTENQFIAK